MFKKGGADRATMRTEPSFSVSLSNQCFWIGVMEPRGRQRKTRDDDEILIEISIRLAFQRYRFSIFDGATFLCHDISRNVTLAKNIRALSLKEAQLVRNDFNEIC